MFKVFADTNPGRVRSHNEDAYLVFMPPGGEGSQKGALFAVADGVGGHAKGEVASSLGLKTLKEVYFSSPLPPMDALLEGIKAAHQKILSLANSSPAYKGMATTCTAIVLGPYGGYMVHVGDSRCYLFRNGALWQLTEDHTLVNQLVLQGKISKNQAFSHPQKHVLTKALGIGSFLKPQVATLRYQQGDIFLLCTDGLHDVVDRERILEILKSRDIIEAGALLINIANEAGGPDNITVVLVQVEGDQVKDPGSTEVFD